ncbi:uncharacterized protein LOC113868015 [Abrus precatorius]|uniref:Uncharacterized protein LOC113868015 n=1 Tax=Abrus precatorius TaxID=3816 RepID=A0A8B8LSL6_ABRPR|nr:uncharacterized protein LOC113868015 [Abrus precatorius]
MKKRASTILKLLAALSSMAKSKSLALKSKTNAIKARLIIFSLVMNKKYVMSTISDKFQSLLGHHSLPKEDCSLEHGSDDQNKDTVVFNDNAHSNKVVSNPNETQVVVEDKDHDGHESYYRYGEDDDGGDGKYPDLTHTMFESEGLDLEGSVIDLVKCSKEEAGQEFKMEDEIDHMADLFIQKFRRQILLQKQDSLKRYHETMLK